MARLSEELAAQEVTQASFRRLSAEAAARIYRDAIRAVVPAADVSCFEGVKAQQKAAKARKLLVLFHDAMPHMDEDTYSLL